MDPKEKAPVLRPAETNSRRHGRVRCESIHSSLGEIADLSASGARVRRRRRLSVRLGSMVNFDIEGLDGPVRVLARVIWMRRVSFFKHEIGVLFEDVSPQVRRALVDIAKRSPSNMVLGRIELERARRSA
jgi:hypothetical protein